MTALAEVIPLRRPRLPVDTTRDALEALARGWDDNTDPRRIHVLRELAHPSLAGSDLYRLWGDYRGWLSLIGRLEHGARYWNPGLGADWETALANARGEAEYALLDLTEGISSIRGNGGDVA